MINGINTVDFTFAKDGKTSISSDLPKARTDLISVFQYAYKPEPPISAKNAPQNNDFKMNEKEAARLERVQVQHLQTHAQLRNNRWNYQTFCSLGAAMDPPMRDPTSRMPNNNFENKSAFIKCNQEERGKQISVATGVRVEFSSNADIMMGESKRHTSSDNNGPQAPIILTGDKITSDTTTTDGDRRTWPIYYRTEDQENAFRRIEDVHNYAKLNRYGTSNDSSDGSLRGYDDEEEDDDDEDEEERGGAYDEFNVAENETELLNNTEIVGKKYGKLQGKHMTLSKVASKPSNLTPIKSKIESTVSEDVDIIVDVEAMGTECAQELIPVPPAHHARRPMNAFLIFCKRHRAIVKDRYKSLENRAITKILGDWWASLDPDEKECFTTLAQQNKDAFFSAHPNFKWYKLPAPPLRTLSTRPSNADRAPEEDENVGDEPKSPNKAQTGSFFKLADETQMGELSSLINSKNESQSQCPLQKALGETSHFLSAHMPNVDDLELTDALNDKRKSKRRPVTESSFSSNSSEDDVLPKKSSRSCKGKIYQELVSSGQIAPITKKPKQAKSTNITQFPGEIHDPNDCYPELFASPAASYFQTMGARANKSKRTVSESDISHHFADQFGQFDLEEKIRKLPALNLDAYLQRKRNTKKKKKFATRKRNSHSVSFPITELRPEPPITPPKEIRNQAPLTQQAVGSQKRKARKESITRRDISAIENEVASLIPLTSEFNRTNGCYYFNDTPSATMESPAKQIVTLAVPKATLPLPTLSSSSEAAITPSAAVNQIPRAYSSYNDSITTTSDLLILAEAAAKRTELTN